MEKNEYSLADALEEIDDEERLKDASLILVLSELNKCNKRSDKRYEKMLILRNRRRNESIS